MRKSLFSTLKRDGINNTELFFLSTIVSLFIFLRIPSLIEPSWYGDEGIYQVIGKAISSGKILYKEIWDNKPPLLYIFYGLVNGDLFSIKLLSLLFGVFSVIGLFLLAKKLYKNRESMFASTAVFALLFAGPLLEGTIANAENFMLLPVIAAFYFLVSAYVPNVRTKEIDKSVRKKYMVISGVFFSVAFLFKAVALFDFSAGIFLIGLLSYLENGVHHRKNKKIFDYNTVINFFKKEAGFFLAFIIPILLVSIYFILQGAFTDYFRAVFSQNVGYVGYGNYFIIPQGQLYIKTILLGIALAGIIFLRKHLSFPQVIVYVWVAFSLFNAFFSARPYTHYLLVLLPAVSLLFGLIFESQKGRIINGVLCLFIIVIAGYTFTYYKKNIAYYRNYLSFMTGNRSVDEYRDFFDKNTTRDYALAGFIKEKSADQPIFLWSDSGQIYALSEKLPIGKYIVAYHMTFYKNALQETKSALNDIKPRFIIDTKQTMELQSLLLGYVFKYKIADAKIYERQ